MPGYTKDFTRARRISAHELNLNGVTLDAARTSNVFAPEGMNQLMVNVTRVDNSGTATSFFFEHSGDNGTTWRRLTTGSISSGTETLSVHTVTIASSVANYSYYKSFLVASKDLMRITFNSNSDVADIVTVDILLGVSG
jgi:hypothetical protein